MHFLSSKFLLLSAAALVSCNEIVCCKKNPSSSSSSSSLSTISEACESGLDFGSISQFREFLLAFKAKSEEQLILENVPKGCTTTANRMEILDLERLITVQDVCDPNKIDDLINYHKKYLSDRNNFLRSKPITKKFFTKYAIQVAYICKRNMIKNLETAREELKARGEVFEEARDKVYNEEPSIKSNIKLIEEQPDDPGSTNIKPQDEFELSLNEYREALVKLRRPEDILTFDRDNCLKNRNRESKITIDKLQIFFKPALICHQLHRYYSGSLLSVAKLANIGYVALDEEIDSELQESPAIKDWIIAVQVCEPMLYMSTKETHDNVATIDTCSPKINAIEPMVYQDNLIELDASKLNEMISKSQATRSNAQKLMKSALKKMTKVNIMKQLKSGATRRSIFSKSLTLFSDIDSGGDGRGKILSSNQGGRSSSFNNNRISILMPSGLNTMLAGNGAQSMGDEPKQLTDQESYELLMGVVDKEHSGGNGSGQENGIEENDNGVDKAVSFDPMTSLFTTLTVLMIMLSFEWLFFIVMTLAARLCHHLYFNFDNLLTFPPKFLSWSDADFAKFNAKMEQIDEDDFLDYDELSPDEQEQRDRLTKVFGRAPPMLYKD